MAMVLVLPAVLYPGIMRHVHTQTLCITALHAHLRRSRQCMARNASRTSQVRMQVRSQEAPSPTLTMQKTQPQWMQILRWGRPGKSLRRSLRRRQPER